LTDVYANTDAQTGREIYSGDEAASGNYVNGGFTLTINNQFLQSISGALSDGGYYTAQSLTASDDNAKLALIEIIQGYKSGIPVREFNYRDATKAVRARRYAYCYHNRDGR
jgi:hypothetical protein